MLKLVAAGRPVDAIAHELSLAPRSVYRRLQKVRRRYRVASNAELRAELIRAGF